MTFKKQISARWCLEEGCRPDIDEAPAFYPTEEVFLKFYGGIGLISQVVSTTSMIAFSFGINLVSSALLLAKVLFFSGVQGYSRLHC